MSADTPVSPALSRVTVQQFLDVGREHLDLELLAGAQGVKRLILEPMFHRPGLALTGFFDYFASQRIQVIGMAEYAYLGSLTKNEREDKVARFMAADIPCIIFCSRAVPYPEVVSLAEQHGVPVLSTSWGARRVTYDGSFVLHELVAPSCKVHGTMVEVAGVGVLIEGAAGLGKSETGLGLIKRGHALVADDLTVLRVDTTGKLIAAAMPTTRYFMEIRGLGIIYVPAIFGIAAIRGEKELNVVVTLRHPDQVEELDRSGMSDLRRELLGVSVPQILIPVAPGRDLVNIVETAAQEFKLRQIGYFAANKLDQQIKEHHLALAAKQGK